jgi:hypothetical protein
MKKYLYYYFTLFILLTNQSAHSQLLTQNKFNFLSNGYKGKIKQIKHEKYLAKDKFGEIIKDQKCQDESFIIRLNYGGFIIENILHSADSSVLSKTTFKYNDLGNFFEANTFNDDGVLSGKIINKFDSYANIIEQSVYKSDGSLFLKYLCKYDNKGTIIEMNEFNSNGNLETKSTYNYNQSGNLIEEIKEIKDNNEVKICRYTYKYDLNGNIAEERIIFDDSPQIKVVPTIRLYKYDIRGNKIEVSHIDFKTSDIIHKKISKYDDKNNLIEESTYDRKGSLIDSYSYIYNYDSYDNWVKKIEFKNNIPKFITFQVFEYFNK